MLHCQTSLGLFPGMKHVLFVVLMLVGPVPGCRAGEVTVAVAANFLPVLSRLSDRFAADTPHRLRIVSGSTGQMTAQIIQGAPFDVLLAADQVRPRLLEARGLVVPGSRFTYAVGQLALWRPRATKDFDGRAFLIAGRYRHLAIANPDLAPYGQAALNVLDALGVTQSAQPKLVRGQNIGQVFSLAASGNVEVALVALSQVITGRHEGHYWIVPDRLHSPIRQDAVLLKRAQHSIAAKDFMRYLASAPVRELIGQSGYLLDGNGS